MQKLIRTIDITDITMLSELLFHGPTMGPRLKLHEKHTNTWQLFVTFFWDRQVTFSKGIGDLQLGDIRWFLSLNQLVNMYYVCKVWIYIVLTYAVFVVSSFCSDTVKSCLAMIGVYKSPPFLSLMQLAMKTVTGCGIF